MEKKKKLSFPTAFTVLFIVLILLTCLSEWVYYFPAFVVPFPGFVDFVLDLLTFSKRTISTNNNQ